MPHTSVADHRQHYCVQHSLDTEVDQRSIDSRLDPEVSEHGSRPQTPSVLFTPPDSDLADVDPPSPAEDFQTYAQLMIRMISHSIFKSITPQPNQRITFMILFLRTQLPQSLFPCYRLFLALLIDLGLNHPPLTQS